MLLIELQENFSLKKGGYLKLLFSLLIFLNKLVYNFITFPYLESLVNILNLLWQIVLPYSFLTLVMMIFVILVSTWSVDHENEEDSIQTFRVNIHVSEILVFLNGSFLKCMQSLIKRCYGEVCTTT